MEIFYCSTCQLWYEFHEGSHNKVVRKATKTDPEEYSDKNYCNKCNNVIEDINIHDDVLKILNLGKIRPVFTK